MTAKLIILPHAGGASHAYQRFAHILPEEIALFFHDYPGHGRRSSEPLPKTMDDLLEDLLEQAGATGFFQDEIPWAIFGHSMGALVAHGAIQKRIKEGLSAPAAFFASGARPPSQLLVSRSEPVPGTASPKLVSTLPGDLFWSKMAGYGGIPRELIENPGIQDYFESLLRADFSAIETHLPDIAPIDVPLHIFYGTRDRHVVSCLDGWVSASASQIRFHPFDGSHFFVFDHLDRIGEIIGQAFILPPL